MRPSKKLAGVVCGLGMALILATAGGTAGCSNPLGSVAGGIGTDNNNVTATTSDGVVAVGVALNIVFRSTVAAFGNSSGALALNQSTNQILDNFKNNITAQSSFQCNEGLVANPSGTTATIVGSVSGDCFVEASGTENSSTVLAQCNNYNDGSNTGDIAVDGDLSADIDATSTSTQSIFVFSNVVSRNLFFTFSDGKYCSAVVNFSARETIDVNSGSGSATVNSGSCDEVCGEAFTVNGSETF